MDVIMKFCLVVITLLTFFYLNSSSYSQDLSKKVVAITDFYVTPGIEREGDLFLTELETIFSQYAEYNVTSRHKLEQILREAAKEKSEICASKKEIERLSAKHTSNFWKKELKDTKSCISLAFQTLSTDYLVAGQIDYAEGMFTIQVQLIQVIGVQVKDGSSLSKKMGKDEFRQEISVLARKLVEDICCDVFEESKKKNSNIKGLWMFAIIILIGILIICVVIVWNYNKKKSHSRVKTRPKSPFGR